MTPDAPTPPPHVQVADPRYAAALKAAAERRRPSAQHRRTALARAVEGHDAKPATPEAAEHAASVERARALVQPPAELPTPARLPWGLRALVALGLLARP